MARKSKQGTLTVERPKIFLDQLTKLDIHKIVSGPGYWQGKVQNHSVLLDVHQDFLIFYIDSEPVKQWKLSSMPHYGRLRNGGSIPWQCDEIYFVVGADGKRYAHIWIDPESLSAGTRSELGARYRRKARSERFSAQERREGAARVNLPPRESYGARLLRLYRAKSATTNT